MIVPQNEIFSVLRQYNPWWTAGTVRDLPAWRRAAFSELILWIAAPPAPRAVLLSGARQVGKTTLLLQGVEALLDRGIRPERILYATFDHPLLKLIGLEGVLKAWREIHPRSASEIEFLLLDEIQYTQNWQTWLKHQVDFEKRVRIVVTGSAVPLETEGLESGVGRWHTLRLATLSFAEYLQIQEIELPRLPEVASLSDVFSWSPADLVRTGEQARPLVAHFHEYLLRGGFPQTARIESLPVAQKLLREDIVDKVLKRDMTALFGVRRVLELERTFLYLCLHDGGLIDLQALCTSLGLKKPTVNRFIDLLEAAHLIYRLPPFGYGKEVLRGKFKVYLADPAIAGSVLLKGRGLLEDEIRLGAAAETAFFKHVFARYYQIGVNFSYWRGRKDLEVDLVAEVQLRLIPFEVKYSRSRVLESDLKGLRALCEAKEIPRAYVVTREMSDFEVASLPGRTGATPLLKIPAPLACFWLSRLEGIL
jgi:predicted AAA+ superfamily ATPase